MAAHHRDVDQAVGEQARGFDRVRGRDVEAQGRRVGGETPQHGQQQRLAQVVAGGDAQGGHALGRQLVEQPLERRRLVEQAGQAAEHGLAGRAGTQAAPRAFEQRHAEALLDAAQLLRDGGRRLVQPASGLAHGAGLRDDQRVVKSGNQGRIHS